MVRPSSTISLSNGHCDGINLAKRFAKVWLLTSTVSIQSLSGCRGLNCTRTDEVSKNSHRYLIKCSHSELIKCPHDEVMKLSNDEFVKGFQNASSRGSHGNLIKGSHDKAIKRSHIASIWMWPSPHQHSRTHFIVINWTNKCGHSAFINFCCRATSSAQ